MLQRPPVTLAELSSARVRGCQFPLCSLSGDRNGHVMPAFVGPGVTQTGFAEVVRVLAVLLGVFGHPTRGTITRA